MFSLPKATGTFAAIVVGELLFGAAVGWLSLRMRHRARDPQVEITLSLITPYLAFWIPDHFGGSGVIATVACGLYMSWNGPLLISSATRLQGIFFWDLVIYLIEGLLFLLTGFQMRSLFEKSKAFPLDEILFATALVAVIVIVARFAWVYPATYLPRLLNPRLRARDPMPPWRNAFVIAFTGVRGAVSLAAALALPFALPNGEAFPHRDLILFVSFGVIFITLVGLGLGLPLVVRWLGVAQAGREEHIAEHEAEIAARREALDAALKSLDAITDDRELSDEVVKLLRARHEIRTNQLPDSLDPDVHDVSAAGTELTRELIAAERKFIHALLRDGKITDETRRRIERDLDLEEASLAIGSIGGFRCRQPSLSSRRALATSDAMRPSMTHGIVDHCFAATNCRGVWVPAFAGTTALLRRHIPPGPPTYPAASPKRSIITAVRSLALLVTQAPERTV